MQPQVQAPGKWPSCEGEGRRGLGPTGIRTEQTQGGLLMRVILGKNRLLEARERGRKPQQWGCLEGRAGQTAVVNLSK